MYNVYDKRLWLLWCPKVKQYYKNHALLFLWYLSRCNQKLGDLITTCIKLSNTSSTCQSAHWMFYFVVSLTKTTVFVTNTCWTSLVVAFIHRFFGVSHGSKTISICRKCGGIINSEAVVILKVKLNRSNRYKQNEIRHVSWKVYSKESLNHYQKVQPLIIITSRSGYQCYQVLWTRLLTVAVQNSTIIFWDWTHFNSF